MTLLSIYAFSENRRREDIRQFYGRKYNYVHDACTVNTCDIWEVKNALVKSVCCDMVTPSAVLLCLLLLSVRESRDTWSRGSSVAVVIRPRTGRPEVRIPARTRRFSFPKSADRLSCPPSPVLLLDGYRGPFLAARRQWRDADHSPPSSAEVKNEWRYTSTLLCALAWTGTTLALLRGTN